jgi:hypothetical protein
MTTIKGQRLTTFELAEDGSTVAIHVTDQEARPAALVLPIDCLKAMMMSLPEMMRQALHRRFGDPSLRLVYPLGDWTLESSNDPGTLILSLATPDGFQISFALREAELREMASTADAEPIAAPTTPPRPLN